MLVIVGFVLGITEVVVAFLDCSYIILKIVFCIQCQDECIVIIVLHRTADLSLGLNAVACTCMHLCFNIAVRKGSVYISSVKL